MLISKSSIAKSLAFTMIFASVVGAQKNVYKANVSIPDSYIDLLAQNEGLYQWYALEDLDGDGVAELLAERSENWRAYYIDVFYDADGAAMQFTDADYGSAATVSMNAQANGAYDTPWICANHHIHTDWGGGMGHTNTGYAFSDGLQSIALSLEYSNNFGTGCYINGDSVDEATYQQLFDTCTNDHDLVFYDNTAANRGSYPGSIEEWDGNGGDGLLSHSSDANTGDQGTQDTAATTGQTSITGDLQPGDIVELGTYEQDNDSATENEAIEWKVLSAEDERILLVSVNALDAKAYDESNDNATWEESSLRAWLNGEFMTEAFTAEEQAKLLTTEENDKVFILSMEEAEAYLPTETDRMCTATQFALAHFADANTEDGACWWWLRVPGRFSESGVDVGMDGGIWTRETTGAYDGFYDAVRPAVWIAR